MNKEPLILYILRLIILMSLPLFLGMLYWSSLLLENELRELRADINHLTVSSFNGPLQSQQSISDSLIRNAPSKQSLPDNQYPNLLKNDPFFEKTLPHLVGDHFIPHGIQHRAELMKPNNLHPFSNFGVINEWQNLCSVSVAQPAFGKFETMTPNMGIKIEERPNSKTGKTEFWVFLRNDVYWQPLKQDFFTDNITLAPHFLQRHQVTAHDYKFFYDALMNPYIQEPKAIAIRGEFNSMEELIVIDDFTFIVRWKPDLVKEKNGKSVSKIKYISKQLTGSLTPLPSFLYKYFSNGKKIIEEDFAEDTYRTNSVWAQNFTEHWAKNIIASCGPWIFDGLNERQIKFIRNPNFFSPLAALTKSIEIDFKDSPDNIWQAFKAGLLDQCILAPEQLLELEMFLKSDSYEKQKLAGLGIKRLDYLRNMYAYIAWNENKPYFKSAKVRKALTMSIDRRRIIEQNLHGMGEETTGSFTKNSSAYDSSIEPLPFSPQQAARLLEEEGWYDSDGDGIIDKVINGKRIPFSFSLTYYIKNPTTKSYCEYLSKALKAVGIECILKGMDMADLSAELDDHSFEAITMFWSLEAPPENPRQLWHSSGANQKGSSNIINFSNPEIDHIINQLDYEYDVKERINLYHRFDAIIHQEQPYTFLFIPKTVFIYREQLQNVFIPADRQDLIPGADVSEPDPNIFWIK